MKKEEIELEPSKLAELLVELMGGQKNGKKYVGLLNEKINGLAKFELGKLTKKIQPIVGIVEAERISLLVKNGGTKEFGIPSSNIEGIRSYIKEYNDYINEIDKTKEVFAFNKISIKKSGYLDIISECNYSLALELLFTDGQED